MLELAIGPASRGARRWIACAQRLAPGRPDGESVPISTTIAATSSRRTAEWTVAKNGVRRGPFGMVQRAQRVLSRGGPTRRGAGHGLRRAGSGGEGVLAFASPDAGRGADPRGRIATGSDTRRPRARSPRSTSTRAAREPDPRRRIRGAVVTRPLRIGVVAPLWMSVPRSDTAGSSGTSTCLSRSSCGAATPSRCSRAATHARGAVSSRWWSAASRRRWTQAAPTSTSTI